MSVRELIESGRSPDNIAGSISEQGEQPGQEQLEHILWQGGPHPSGQGGKMIPGIKNALSDYAESSRQMEEALYTIRQVANNFDVKDYTITGALESVLRKAQEQFPEKQELINHIRVEVGL